jgi:hypothetical protein
MFEPDAAEMYDFARFPMNRTQPNAEDKQETA